MSEELRNELTGLGVVVAIMTAGLAMWLAGASKKPDARSSLPPVSPPVAVAPAAVKQPVAAAVPAPAVTSRPPVQPDSVAMPVPKDVPLRQTRFLNQYDCVVLLEKETLVFWGARNQYGAVRIDKCYADRSADYTAWYLAPSGTVIGSFSDAVCTTGTVRLADERKKAVVNGVSIKCGDTQLGWLGPCGIVVPRTCSVAISTNADVGTIDLPSLEWQSFPFYLNARQ